jgi:hypothetical protein
MPLVITYTTFISRATLRLGAGDLLPQVCTTQQNHALYIVNVFCKELVRRKIQVRTRRWSYNSGLPEAEAVDLGFSNAGVGRRSA